MKMPQRRLLARNRLLRIDRLDGCGPTLELSLGPFSLRVDPAALRLMARAIEDALEALEADQEEARALLDVALPGRRGFEWRSRA